VEEVVTLELLKRATKRTPPKQAKSTTRKPVGEDASYQSRFYNGIIQGATSFPELKGIANEMKGFLTGRLDLLQQKSAERKWMPVSRKNSGLCSLRISVKRMVVSVR
jgi:hypothetical protein